jgi:hypothetical protein
MATELPDSGEKLMRFRSLATISMSIGMLLATGIASQAHDEYGGYYEGRRFNRYLHENGIPHSHGYGRYSRGNYHEYLHEEGVPHGGLNHYLHDNGIPHYHGY